MSILQANNSDGKGMRLVPALSRQPADEGHDGLTDADLKAMASTSMEVLDEARQITAGLCYAAAYAATSKTIEEAQDLPTREAIWDAAWIATDQFVGDRIRKEMSRELLSGKTTSEQFWDNLEVLAMSAALQAARRVAVNATNRQKRERNQHRTLLIRAEGMFVKTRKRRSRSR